MDTSFIELPNKINVDPLKYYKTTREVCYWTTEKHINWEIILRFTTKAKDYNLTEDQALAILMFNDFDMTKAEYDMKIFRPIKGLGKVDVKKLVKVISDGIVKTVKSREHRDFNDVLLMFPGYTIGDVLGAYSKHRFFVKKETYKAKKSIKKSTLKPNITNGGLKEIELLSRNHSCPETQFPFLYKKYYEMIHDSCNLDHFIARNLSDLKHCNGTNMRLCDAQQDGDADGILSLLRKMNRKKNKPGSMFERSQLSNILSSVALERQTRSVNSTPVKRETRKQLRSYSQLCTRSSSPNVDESEMSIEDKLYDYIKSDNNLVLAEQSEDYNDKDIISKLKVLSNQHEAVLDSFKDYLPDPNVFQQLSHSWSNMDFAILLLGLSEFGKDFAHISDSIFTKTEAMVASFYCNHSSEFNLDEIVRQPFRNTELDLLSNDNGPEETVPSPKIKVVDNEHDTSSAYQSSSNFDTNPAGKSSNSRKRKNPVKNSPKIKRSKRSKDLSLENKSKNDHVPVTMNLRSRLETKNVIKTLIDKEKKSKHLQLNSKKNLKRKTKIKSEDEFQQCKRMNKTGQSG